MLLAYIVNLIKIVLFRTGVNAATVRKFDLKALKQIKPEEAYFA